jgi:tight adherence protein B
MVYGRMVEMDKLILIPFVFFVSFSLFYLLVTSANKAKRLNRRIDDYIPLNSDQPEEEVSVKPKKNVMKEVVLFSSKAFKGFSLSKKAEKRLLQAGSTLTVEEFIVLRIFYALGVSALSLVLGIHWISSIILFPIGFGLPDFYMNQKRKKRLNLLPHQLIDTLGMMGNSMRAGFSFIQAMQLAGKEMPDPIGPEFERVVREIGLGIPIEEVFEAVINRLPSKELEVALQAILAQRKSGGNLAELLETMEETIRGRVRVLGELKTLTAQGKMSSWVITLLPVGLALYFYFMSPDYFLPMFDHPLGIAMISIASIFIILGWVVIQKIVKIEV